MMFFKPWLKRTFRDGTVVVMDTSYVVTHLDNVDKAQIASRNLWRNSKEKRIVAALEGGKKPGSFPEVKLVLSASSEKFAVSDGISRLRAFFKLGVKNVRVKLYHGASF